MKAKTFLNTQKFKFFLSLSLALSSFLIKAKLYKKTSLIINENVDNLCDEIDYVITCLRIDKIHYM